MVTGLQSVRIMSTEVCVKLPANGRNNFQHRWANNVGSCAVLVGSGVPTDATTPNNVETCSRDPYSCFLRVVSRASKRDGILACLQFGSPGQKYRIMILKEW